MPLRPTTPIASSNSTTDKTALRGQIKYLAQDLGFDLCGFTAPAISADDKNNFHHWLNSNFSAGMEYMVSRRGLREDPALLLPGAQTVITLGVSYFQGALPPKPGPLYGRVARYAWGLDYHDIITARLKKFIDELKILVGSDAKFLTAVDSKPLLERSLAVQAGLGFVGKNTLLISSRPASGFHRGSWLFLSEILTDLKVPLEVEPPAALVGCGKCRSCLDKCPTNAFEGSFRLNSGRCISYLTIENKGIIPRDLRPHLRDWIFGCDVCQDVCPFNTRSAETRWPEFRAGSGTGGWLFLPDILQIPTQKVFSQKFGKTPLARAKRRGLLRNACVAAGNSKEEAFIPPLTALLHDPEPLLRSHALWALGQMLPTEKIRTLAEKVKKTEPDQLVVEECRTWL